MRNEVLAYSKSGARAGVRRICRSLRRTRIGPRFSGCVVEGASRQLLGIGAASDGSVGGRRGARSATRAGVSWDGSSFGAIPVPPEDRVERAPQILERRLALRTAGFDQRLQLDPSPVAEYRIFHRKSAEFQHCARVQVTRGPRCPARDRDGRGYGCMEPRRSSLSRSASAFPPREAVAYHTRKPIKCLVSKLKQFRRLTKGYN